jgi:hypothetical protein
VILLLLMVGLSVAAARALARGYLGAPGGARAMNVAGTGNGTIRYGGAAGGAYGPTLGGLRSMPYGARSFAYGGSPYYWYGGGWYAPAYYGSDLYYYPAVEPMQGVVGSVPMPYWITSVGNQVYYVSNGVYYQPFEYGGMVWYRVVAAAG